MKRGFTLVETIIYVALAALVLGLIIELVLVGSRSFARAREERVITMDAVSALERIVRETRLATSASSVSTEFYLQDGSVWIREGAAESPLTSGKTEVTNLAFQTLSDPNSEAVQISLSLKAREGSGTIYDFKTMAVLRGFYADVE